MTEMAKRIFAWPQDESQVPIWFWLVWATLFFVAASIMPRDVSYDVAHYHVHNGWAALNGRMDKDFAPAEMHSFINPAYNIFVYWLIERLPGPIVNGILSIPQALILPAVYYLCRTFSTAITGRASFKVCLITAVVCFAADAQFGIMASIRNDSWHALAFIAALALSVTPQGGLANWRKLALGSFIMGAALGLKATNIPYTIAYAVFTLVLADSWRLRRDAALACGIFGFVGAFIFFAPHAWVLWQEFGNPVFPMANDIFKAPLGPDGYEAYQRRTPEGLLGLLTYPFVFTVDHAIIGSGDYSDLRFLIGYLIAPVLLVTVFLKMRAGETQSWHRLVIAFSAAMLIAMLGWMHGFAVLRYLLAAWILGPLFVLIFFLIRSDSADLDPRSRLFGVAIASFLLITTGPFEVRRAAWDGLAAPYVEAQVPEPQRFEDAFVIFSGVYPTAFLAPSFPEATTFGHAVAQDFSRPSLENYRRLQRDAIAASDKPVYAVIFTGSGLQETLDELVKQERLRGDAALCEEIPNSFETGVFEWVVCPLDRMPEMAATGVAADSEL